MIQTFLGSRGGEIIEGQGSNSITVRWNIEPKGSISVVEKIMIVQA